MSAQKGQADGLHEQQRATPEEVAHRVDRQVNHQPESTVTDAASTPAPEDRLAAAGDAADASGSRST
jgi:hypothetical protein